MMNAKRSSKANLTRYAFLVPALVGLLLMFSISKAARVKIYRAAPGPAVPEATRAPGILPVTNIRATIPAKTKKIVLNTRSAGFDTIKTGKVSIRTSGSTDSLNYVINGVKASKADFKALDSDHIYAIEILPAGRAKKIFEQLDNNRSVLFVTTDDSEAGKKFKEKIDQLNSNNYTLAANVSTWNSDESAVRLAGKDEAVTITMPAAMYRADALKRPRMLTKDGGKWVITENTRPLVAGSIPDSAGVHVMAAGKIKALPNSYTLDARMKGKAGNMMIYAPPGHPLMYTPKALMGNKWAFNTETNINHLSTKMIMIDGKEATAHDLKKLSAANIESMSVKSGGEVTREYGDKAKNGIVFIVTKKGAR